MAGRWYELQRDSNFADPTKSCLADDFVVNFNGSVTISKNQFTLDDGWTQNLMNAVLVKNKTGNYNVFTT
jgi:hypothetical protein